jgi:transcriptional regulator with XRE-family HTH domain
MRVEEVVGKRLRDARRAAGLTQLQLGEAMADFLPKKWVGQQISQAEEGNRKLTAEELFAFCCILARPVNYFFIPTVDVSVIEVRGRQGTIDAETVRDIQMPDMAYNAALPALRQLMSLESSMRDAITSLDPWSVVGRSA